MKARMAIARVLLLAAFLITTAGLSAQSAMTVNAGIGYFGDNLVNPGVVGLVELERNFGNQVSVPSTLSVGVHRSPGYYAINLRVHTGFRKYFDSGLFIEQSMGIGVIANVFTVDSIWYIDTYGARFRYAGLDFGISPSVSVGAGIDLGRNAGRSHLLWVRPTVYWNLGIRGLHIPYGAVQVGYTISLGRS